MSDSSKSPQEQGPPPGPGNPLYRIPVVRDITRAVVDWANGNPATAFGLKALTYGYAIFSALMTVVGGPTYVTAEARRHGSLAEDYSKASACDVKLDKGEDCTREETLSLRIAAENEAIRCGGFAPPCLPEHFMRYSRVTKPPVQLPPARTPQLSPQSAEPLRAAGLTH